METARALWGTHVPYGARTPGWRRSPTGGLVEDARRPHRPGLGRARPRAAFVSQPGAFWPPFFNPRLRGPGAPTSQKKRGSTRRCVACRPCRLRPPLSCATRGRTRGASLADVERNRVPSRVRIFCCCCHRRCAGSARVVQRYPPARVECANGPTVPVGTSAGRICLLLSFLSSYVYVRPSSCCRGGLVMHVSVFPPPFRPSVHQVPQLLLFVQQECMLYGTPHRSTAAFQRRTGIVRTLGIIQPPAVTAPPILIGPTAMPCISHYPPSASAHKAHSYCCHTHILLALAPQRSGMAPMVMLE